jgi:phytanoyl-CoA dioxygenase PhyH
MGNPLAEEFEKNGILIMPNLLTMEQLHGMQMSFNARLKRMRWNNFDGYEKTERYRHMVHDVLLLDQGFVDVALHQDVMRILREYLGNDFELVEAKGWKSLPTKRDFHGWHGDAWYDQEQVRDRIPREVKLGLYLTDVTTGRFVYVKGTHGQQHPKPLSREEARALPRERFVEVTGPAGMAFLFDTSGFHRQNVPILKERNAVFYAYHDPRVPLQKEDIDYYRYHPLQLNASFLGHLSEEDRHVLGFGNTTNFQRGYERKSTNASFLTLVERGYSTQIIVGEFYGRVKGKLSRLLSARTPSNAA